MAEDFRQTAERLRRIAQIHHQVDGTAVLSADQQADVRYAADVLSKLDKMKQDLLSHSDKEDQDDLSDQLAAELLSLFDIQGGS